MTLEEIKQAIADRIDAAWSEVKTEVDADKVRTYVQGLTAELLGHVYAVEAALVNHVLGKQDPVPAAPANPAPTDEQGPGADSTPAATDSAPAPSLVDGSVPDQPTGMASNPEPAPVEQLAAAAQPDPEPTQ